MDHAIEYLYRPDTHPVLLPLVLNAIRDLFTLLPLSKKDPKDVDVRQRLQISAFGSLWPEARKGALGLSHGLRHKRELRVRTVCPNRLRLTLSP